MLEGDFAETCAKKDSARVDWGTRGTVKLAQTWSEDRNPIGAWGITYLINVLHH